jgi:hypothetical protein
MLRGKGAGKMPGDDINLDHLRSYFGCRSAFTGSLKMEEIEALHLRLKPRESD